MNFEDEMSRFEAEINRSAAFVTGGGFIQPRPAFMDAAFITNQIHARAGLPTPAAGYAAAQPVLSQPQPRPKLTVSTGPAVIQAAPQRTAGSAQVISSQSSSHADDDEDIFAKLATYEKAHKKEKKEEKKAKKKAKTSMTPSAVLSDKAKAVAPPAATITSSVTASVPPVVPQASTSAPKPFATAAYDASKSHTPASAKLGDSLINKAKKQKRVIRTGGGQIWEDDSLKEWDPNDFRLFCGDLGNDVTDEVLARTFGRYPSFQKAKVIRDKKSNKTKGYGFVSFQDPTDFTKAMRELNGKYVGTRPIKLRKSNWKDRNIDIVRKKQKEKQQMGYKW